MAAITATDWTETVEKRIIDKKQRRNRVRLVLGSNGGFYPSSGGIPLPTTLGMKRNVDYVTLIQASDMVSGQGVLWNYYVTSHNIRGFWLGPTTQSAASALTELPTTWQASDMTAGGVVFYVEAVGW